MQNANDYEIFICKKSSWDIFVDIKIGKNAIKSMFVVTFQCLYAVCTRPKWRNHIKRQKAIAVGCFDTH